MTDCHEGLRERIEARLRYETRPLHDETMYEPEDGVEPLLRDCLTALEPAAPAEWKLNFSGWCSCGHARWDPWTNQCHACGSRERCKPEPTVPQPTADDVVRAVYDALCDDESGQVLDVAVRAIRACFAGKS